MMILLPVFTDFYMICRMFMNFDHDKKTPKDRPIKGNNNYVTQDIQSYMPDKPILK